MQHPRVFFFMQKNMEVYWEENTKNCLKKHHPYSTLRMEKAMSVLGFIFSYWPPANIWPLKKNKKKRNM